MTVQLLHIAGTVIRNVLQAIPVFDRIDGLAFLTFRLRGRTCPLPAAGAVPECVVTVITGSAVDVCRDHTAGVVVTERVIADLVHVARAVVRIRDPGAPTRRL